MRKYLMILMALMLCVMTACGGGNEEEVPLQDEMALLPNAYFVGSESIIAVAPEAGVQLVDLTTLEDGTFVYTYEGFAAVNTSVQNYVGELTGVEGGFTVVDAETFRPTVAPDYTLPEGTVSLSKPAQNDKITVIRLEWSEGKCIASISIEDAPVIEPAKPGANKNYGLSHAGAVEFLKELHPSVLGLEGESMEAYNIYIMTGFTYVNGEACLRVKIYTSNEIDTNDHVGTYFLSGDAEHIYRLTEDGLAIEMDQNK